MQDPRLTKLADVLVNYSVKVKKGDLVAIAAEPLAMPLTLAVTRAVLKAGGNPFWLPRSEEMTEALLAYGSAEQIGFCSPVLVDMVQRIDCQIGFWCQLNTRFMSRVDPAKAAMLQQARRPWFKTFMDRSASGSLRWVGTAYPTNASAQDAEMSLTEYEDFVFRAGLLHLGNPAAEWAKIKDRQQQVCDYLNTKKSVRFAAPAGDGHDGTDLTVSVDGSTWINCCGDSNFPDGEVFAGPKGVDGRVNYTFPVVYNGREVEGVRLVFRGGRVVEASAKKGEDFLHKMLDQDAGARVLGEIAIGTNYNIKQFSKNTLFDEKIGGTFHAAVGAGYPESGSTNESGLHWDMVCDLRKGGTITADGEAFHRDGKFLRAGWPGES